MEKFKPQIKNQSQSWVIDMDSREKSLVLNHFTEELNNQKKSVEKQKQSIFDLPEIAYLSGSVLSLVLSSVLSFNHYQVTTNACNVNFDKIDAEFVKEYGVERPNKEFDRGDCLHDAGWDSFSLATAVFILSLPVSVLTFRLLLTRKCQKMVTKLDILEDDYKDTEKTADYVVKQPTVEQAIENRPLA